MTKDEPALGLEIKIIQIMIKILQKYHNFRIHK
jgi:hypothetical protein